LTSNADNYFKVSKEKDYSSEVLTLKKDFVAPPVKVVIVIPVYNEEKFIEYCINSLEEFIDSKMSKYEISILLAEDGSTDNTLNIISRLARRYNNITVRHNQSKLGRGKAVKAAWKSVDADIYAYFDADLATSISYLKVLIESCTGGFEIVTGSRYVEYSRVKRPFLRKIISRAYNYIINLLFGTSVTDHQCGFKALTHSACKIILKESIFDDWFWDTELFIIARRNDLKIHEFPIEWKERRTTRTPLKRLMKDIWIHGLGIILLLTRR
jgi:glycosyltransferase AglD